MDMWFYDEQTDGVKLGILVEKQLYSGISDYQKIDIIQTKQYGKILVCDDDIVFTEKDEFIYREMMVHVPMAVHPSVRKVLVIGGADGGIVRELLKYDDIEQIDVVEQDKQLIEVCATFFPKLAASLNNEKVHLYPQDGLRFIRTISKEYDLIIVDSPNPYGISQEGYFTKEFYGSCYHALKDDGIMINQHESPFYKDEANQCQYMHKRIIKSFPISKCYQAFIPSYPSGHWLFGFASKKYHPLDDIQANIWNQRKIKTRYYATRLHQGVFALPVYVEELLKDVE
ncbi:MAG: polyamine aminopropyltransferase [Bacillota bacterium]|nr:polyamine aminopropyltransferase [Bacillota bacterium]